MLSTAFTATFGVRHPIVQGGMQWVGRVASNTVSRAVVEILGQGGTFEDVRDLVAGARGRSGVDE